MRVDEKKLYTSSTEKSRPDSCKTAAIQLTFGAKTGSSRSKIDRRDRRGKAWAALASCILHLVINDLVNDSNINHFNTYKSTRLRYAKVACNLIESTRYCYMRVHNRSQISVTASTVTAAVAVTKAG